MNLTWVGSEYSKHGGGSLLMQLANYCTISSITHHTHKQPKKTLPPDTELKVPRPSNINLQSSLWQREAILLQRKGACHPRVYPIRTVPITPNNCPSRQK